MAAVVLNGMIRMVLFLIFMDVIISKDIQVSADDVSESVEKKLNQGFAEIFELLQSIR